MHVCFGDVSLGDLVKKCQKSETLTWQVGKEQIMLVNVGYHQRPSRPNPQLGRCLFSDAAHPSSAWLGSGQFLDLREVVQAMDVGQVCLLSGMCVKTLLTLQGNDVVTIKKMVVSVDLKHQRLFVWVLYRGDLI